MLTVLMATYNGATTLLRVLDAYCRLEAPAGGWQLLVVDNASDDDSRAILLAYRDRLPLTYLYEARPGKNAALNGAVAVALRDPDSALFVFTDDDATPAPDWLVRLAACAAAQPDYAVFGGAIVPDWAQPAPDWVLRLVPLGLSYALTAPTLADGPVFPGLVWGPNMALRRCIFDAGHRFDTSVGPNGGAYAMGSETLMTRRLSAAGYRAWFCRGAQVAHHIRARQLTAAYLLQRAYRYGRGQYHQDRADGPPAPMPALFGLPRWMWRRAGMELAGALRARLAGDADSWFQRRWELHRLAGYAYETWFGAGRRRARVLITSFSGELGGMELRMGQEATLLAGAGYTSTVATRRFPGFESWAGALRGERVAVAVFDPPHMFEQWRWRRFNKLRAEWLSARRLRHYRPDLVHVAFCWTTYGATALWLAHRCRLATVISVHNTFPPAEFHPWHRPLLAEAFRSVRGIYAVSESAMLHFLHIYQDYIVPATHMTVIPNSVDTVRFVPSPARRLTARAALGLAPDALVLGSVGRLSVQKRPQALLALLQTLLPQFPALVLVLVGNGPLETALRDQAVAAGIAGHVVFAGFRDDIEQWMPAFDLHLLLSQREGFGIATIEAMACGVPVVGSDVPGTSDILAGSEGGLLVPLDDAAATASAVAALLADPTRRQQMGTRARAEAVASYGSERLERQVLAFYNGLV